MAWLVGLRAGLSGEAMDTGPGAGFQNVSDDQAQHKRQWPSFPLKDGLLMFISRLIVVLWENIVIVRCRRKYLGVKCHHVCNAVLNEV